MSSQMSEQTVAGQPIAIILASQASQANQAIISLAEFQAALEKFVSAEKKKTEQEKAIIFLGQLIELWTAENAQETGAKITEKFKAIREAEGINNSGKIQILATIYEQARRQNKPAIVELLDSLAIDWANYLEPDIVTRPSGYVNYTITSWPLSLVLDIKEQVSEKYKKEIDKIIKLMVDKAEETVEGGDQAFIRFSYLVHRLPLKAQRRIRRHIIKDLKSPRFDIDESNLWRFLFQRDPELEQAFLKAFRRLLYDKPSLYKGSWRLMHLFSVIINGEDRFTDAQQEKLNLFVDLLYSYLTEMINSMPEKDEFKSDMRCLFTLYQYLLSYIAARGSREESRRLPFFWAKQKELYALLRQKILGVLADSNLEQVADLYATCANFKNALNEFVDGKFKPFSLIRKRLLEILTPPYKPNEINYDSVKVQWLVNELTEWSDNFKRRSYGYDPALRYVSSKKLELEAQQLLPLIREHVYKQKVAEVEIAVNALKERIKKNTLSLTELFDELTPTVEVSKALEKLGYKIKRVERKKRLEVVADEILKRIGRNQLAMETLMAELKKQQPKLELDNLAFRVILKSIKQVNLGNIPVWFIKIILSPQGDFATGFFDFFGKWSEMLKKFMRRKAKELITQLKKQN